MNLSFHQLKICWGIPAKLNTKTLEELDKIVTKSDSYLPLTSESIKELGIDLKMPLELFGVSIYYKMTPISRRVGKHAEYQLEILLRKNKVADTITLIMLSKDMVEFSNSEKELLRIQELLHNGKIETNIPEADQTLPSDVEIKSSQKPFNDSGAPLPGVLSSFEKIESNDEQGELLIRMTFSKEGELPVSLEVTLTGFLSSSFIDVKMVQKEFGTPISKTLKSISELDKIVAMTSNSEIIFDEKAIEALGLEGVKIPVEHRGVVLKFKLELISKEINKQGKYRLNILFEKGKWVNSIQTIIHSSDVVPVTYTTLQLEREKIEALLVDGKISTNIPNADQIRPGDINIEGFQAPFDFTENYDSDITYKYVKESYDSESGRSSY